MIEIVAAGILVTIDAKEVVTKSGRQCYRRVIASTTPLSPGHANVIF